MDQLLHGILFYVVMPSKYMARLDYIESANLQLLAIASSLGMRQLSS
jgi:hypothetical protein